ncbi:MAG TPA: NUDIX hydrolase [Blastocatellia bacterium]
MSSNKSAKKSAVKERAGVDGAPHSLGTKSHIAASRPGRYCYEYPRPAVTVDIVLFRIKDDHVQVLLIQRGGEPFEGSWAFPGGFVDKDEALEAAARRELMEETGLKNIKIEQFGAFGDPGRDPRGHTVSVAFTALIKKTVVPRAADDAKDAAWFSATRPPRLAFDHAKILKTALKFMFPEAGKEKSTR